MFAFSECLHGDICEAMILKYCCMFWIMGSLSMPLDSSLGALELGTLLSGVLFGVLCAQLYTYHKTCWKSDVKWLRGLVLTVWLLELTVTALSFYSLYNMTVTNFGNLDALADASMPLIVSQFLQHLILTFVQGFFIYRIHKLTGITLISVVASILLALRLLAATAVQALATVSLHEEKNNIVEYVNKYFWITVVKDMLGVATDTFIAAVLLMRLFRERSEAMDQTLPVVDKLILYTVETGFATGCYTILIAVLLLTMKHNYIWIGIWLLSSKVFSNTLLANLNSRASLRTQMHTTVESISRLEIEFGAGSDIVPLGTRLSSADAHLVTLDHRDSVLDAGTTSTHEDIKMMRKTETFASPP